MKANIKTKEQQLSDKYSNHVVYYALNHIQL